MSSSSAKKETKKETGLAISAKKEEVLGDWYKEVLVVSGLHGEKLSRCD